MLNDSNYKLSLEKTSLQRKVLTLSKISKINWLNRGKSWKKKNANIKELEESVDYLEQILQDQDNTVHLFDEVSGHYTLETQECVMNLTSAGVSSGAVGKVIQQVSKLVGKSVDRVPSRQTVDRI